jgi:hypothetical protein
MAEACGAYYGAAQGRDYDRCIDRQQAAVQAIEHRFSFTERIEQPAFNAIRNRCREEWPRDFISRDRCERQAIGDLTGGAKGVRDRIERQRRWRRQACAARRWRAAGA